VIHTPIRAPQASAYAERFVRTVRAECLDWLLIFGRRHLEHVLRRYVTHYNAERPHLALALLSPAGNDKRKQPFANTIERHDVLGGLIHEYRAQRGHRFETPHVWQGAGVLGPETFDAVPFLDLLAEHGSPHAVEER
jgi:hypothetical protein